MKDQKGIPAAIYLPEQRISGYITGLEMRTGEDVKVFVPPRKIFTLRLTEDGLSLFHGEGDKAKHIVTYVIEEG